MADVAGASGPSVAGAGGQVVAGDPQGNDRKVDQKFSTPEEDAGSRPLDHSGVKEDSCPRDGLTEFDCTALEEEIVSHPGAFGCCRMGRCQRRVKEEEPARKF